jgi:hypothetical protein
LILLAFLAFQPCTPLCDAARAGRSRNKHRGRALIDFAGFAKITLKNKNIKESVIRQGKVWCEPDAGT